MANYQSAKLIFALLPLVILAGCGEEPEQETRPLEPKVVSKTLPSISVEEWHVNRKNDFQVGAEDWR